MTITGMSPEERALLILVAYAVSRELHEVGRLATADDIDQAILIVERQAKETGK